jgi:hypothetical protein
MTISVEQLAELLAGIARSQQAIIDAIESESAGWRTTHLLPKLNTSANLRLANVRLMDLPSRVLLRSQGRVPMGIATITRDLKAALNPSESSAAPVPDLSPAGSLTFTGLPAVAAVAGVATAVAAATPAEITPTAAPDDDLNFFET